MYYKDFEALNKYIIESQQGSIPIMYLPLPDYDGMAQFIGIVFNVNKPSYTLNLEWISLGLDHYGDTLQESYVYAFDSLEKLLDYLQLKYNIAVHDIPVKFKFDNNAFADPIKEADKKLLFEDAWNRFQIDFNKGRILDESQQLTYRSA